MADLLPQINTNAGGPKSVEVDNSRVEAQDPSKLIEADKYAKAAAVTSGLPFRTVKLRPGGTHDLNRNC